MTDHACTYPPNGHLGTTGNCVTCGTPAPDPIITYLRDAAEHFIRPRLPLMAAELEDFTGRLAAALSTSEVTA